MGQRIAVVTGLAVTLLVNILANVLPIAGRTTGEVSDSYPVLFTPAGYVFSIWSLIYLGLLAYAIYQILPAQRQEARLTAIAPWFVASCAFNSLWIVAWHYGALALSVILMLGLLLSLIVIYLRLGINLIRVRGADWWVVNLPFRLYLGWIIVATVANLTVFLYSLGWDRWGLSEVLWTILMMAAAALIGLALLRLRRDIVAAMVVIWALLGIALKQSATVTLPIAALILAFVLLVGIAVHWMPQASKLPAKQAN